MISPHHASDMHGQLYGDFSAKAGAATLNVRSYRVDGGLTSNSREHDSTVW